MKRVIPLLILAIACNEYDLTRSEDVVGEEEEDGTATAGGPDIEVSPTSLDFGSVPWDCVSSVQEITISNVGDAALSVESVALAVGANYTIDFTPKALDPGESTIALVYFQPQSESDLSTEVVVTSNDPDEARVEVTVAGDGAEEGLYEETFEQAPYGSVDVLWVIDNSGSMSDALDTVGENFEAFIGPFLEMELDFHLGVVTTDMDNPNQSGQLINGYVDASSSDPEGIFLDAVDQGDSGSGSERGFDAIYAALTDPLLSSTNAGFYREDAALATIIVSDEDDDSDMDADEFASWYNSLKINPDDITFSGVIGDPDNWLGCTNWTNWTDMITAEQAAEYGDAVDATGGVWSSICSEDFEEALNQIAISSLGFTDCFELTGQPANGVSSFEYVQVDGTDISYSSISGWTYDEDLNCVQFNGDSIPLGDAMIDIAYNIDGGCI